MPDRADAIARFASTAEHAPNGALVPQLPPVFTDDMLDGLKLMPWQRDLIEHILRLPPDEPFELIRSVPDRRRWRIRF